MQNITKNIDFFRLFDVLSEEEVYYKENPAQYRIQSLEKKAAVLS